MMKNLITLVSVLVVFPLSLSQEKQQKIDPTHNITQVVENSEIIEAEIPETVRDFAKQITVKITTDNNFASGTLVGKQGNKYLVLTNAHVTRNGKTISIQTHDGKTYNATLILNPVAENLDLALLEFTSPVEYTVATKDYFSIPNEENPVIAAGYSAATGELVVNLGTIRLLPSKTQKGCYSIGYTNDIQQGMSGGPIVNSEGFLVGINGRSDYTSTDGVVPTPEEIEQFRKISWGIPTNTLLAQIKPEIAADYDLPPPVGETDCRPLGKTLTGWAATLEAQAKQFTVRIDSSSGSNGSGVIIAKRGKTYTVLTADHVVCEIPDATGDCLELNYEILTHEGLKHPLKKSSIIQQVGVDLAIFEFESEEDYPVATLADYNPKEDDYVFVAGYPKIGQKDPQWLFSGGQVYDKEIGLLQIRQDDYNTEQAISGSLAISLTGGYELVYSSITYGGMSGGAVLDSAGRVIGIHGRAEGGEVGRIQLGLSLGIPLSTFMGLTDKLKVNPQQLSINNQPPQLSKEQQKDLTDAIFSVEVPQGNATADIWIERGNQLWRLRKYDEAVEAFEQAIKINTNYVYLAWYGKGLALRKGSKYQAAIEAYQQALASLPPQSEAGYNKKVHSSILSEQSTAYSKLKDYEKALGAIEEAIALSPNNPNLYNEKLVVLRDLQRSDLGLEAINQAIKLAPRAAFYLNRGYIYSNLEEYDKALADYAQAININPQFAQVYYNRGYVYSNLEEYDKALADYTQAIIINPNDAKGYVVRGNLYSFFQGDYDKGIADLTQAILIDPQYAQAYYFRGYVYFFFLKDYDKALADFTQAISIDPQDADSYSNRGSVYSNLEEYDKAIADFTQAIKINPQLAQAYSGRIAVYLNLKEYDKALADYAQVILIEPNNVYNYLTRGLLYHYLKKEYDKALADFTQAIKVDRQFAIAYFRRGLLYSDLKEYDKAIADFTQAIAIDPQYDSAYYNRGSVYSNLKEYDKAIADLTQAIIINPQYAEAYTLRGMVSKELGETQKAIQDLQTAAELFRLQNNMEKYEIVMQLLRELEGS